jgi:hypothetical protein
MASAARFRHLLTAAVAACGGKSDEPASSPPAPPPVAVDAPAPPTDADSHNRIAIAVTPPHMPGIGLAKRCAIAGDPLVTDCGGGHGGLAFDGSGTLYVVAGGEVRRFRRADGRDCRFDPEPTSIPLPPPNRRPQRLDSGAIYLRSGGPDWRLVAGAGAVYASDFLGGLFRIDRGRSEPACPDVFGYDTVAALGRRLLIARAGIEQLSPGAHCTARSARIDDKAHGELYAVGDHLYLAANFGHALVRYDGTTAVKLVPDLRLCSTTGVVACGDGACVVDNNCMQVVQLAKSGELVRALPGDKLFDVRPYALSAAATGPGGAVYVLARHKDKDTCEAAIYELPQAVFSL